MKKRLLAIFLFIGSVLTTTAQSSKSYVTSGGEMIFSLATIDNAGVTNGNILRWSPAFNLQVFGNYDFNSHVGFIYGGALRNVGFIYEDPNNSGVRKKFRNYDIGIPVGIKVGNLHKLFVYGGYEIEFPINYKEKTIVNEEKTKFSTWFSSRVPALYHTVFIGVQFPYGVSLKFKYYLSGFFNQNYTQNDGVQPYKGLKANVFYFSISTSLFKGNDIYVKEYRREQQVY
jgi:hypothetical protein